MPCPRLIPVALLAWLAGSEPLLAGCVLTDDHATDRTRREQELLAIAIDRAVAALPVDALGEERVAIDVAALAREVSPYLASVLRRQLLLRGCDVVPLEPTGSATRELRFVVDVAAAESNHKSIEIPIPIPFVSGRIGVPLYERRTQSARVRFSAYLLDQPTNALLETFSTMTGGAFVRETRYLSYFGPYRKSDVGELQEEPSEVDEDWNEVEED
jgi:hypothetical protein